MSQEHLTEIVIGTTQHKMEVIARDREQVKEFLQEQDAGFFLIYYHGDNQRYYLIYKNSAEVVKSKHIEDPHAANLEVLLKAFKQEQGGINLTKRVTNAMFDQWHQQKSSSAAEEQAVVEAPKPGQNKDAKNKEPAKEKEKPRRSSVSDSHASSVAKEKDNDKEKRRRNSSSSSQDPSAAKEKEEVGAGHKPDKKEKEKDKEKKGDKHRHHSVSDDRIPFIGASAFGDTLEIISTGYGNIEKFFQAKENFPGMFLIFSSKESGRCFVYKDDKEQMQVVKLERIKTINFNDAPFKQLKDKLVLPVTVDLFDKWESSKNSQSQAPVSTAARVEEGINLDQEKINVMNASSAQIATALKKIEESAFYLIYYRADAGKYLLAYYEQGETYDDGEVTRRHPGRICHSVLTLPLDQSVKAQLPKLKDKSPVTNVLFSAWQEPISRKPEQKASTPQALSIDDAYRARLQAAVQGIATIAVGATTIQVKIRHQSQSTEALYISFSSQKSSSSAEMLFEHLKFLLGTERLKGRIKFDKISLKEGDQTKYLITFLDPADLETVVESIEALGTIFNKYLFIFAENFPVTISFVKDSNGKVNLLFKIKEERDIKANASRFPLLLTPALNLTADPFLADEIGRKRFLPAEPLKKFESDCGVTFSFNIKKSLPEIEQCLIQIAEFYPAFSVTYKKTFSDPVEKFPLGDDANNVEQHEAMLRDKFKDPELKLVRVSKSEGGGLRLLVVDPVVAAIIPRLVSEGTPLLGKPVIKKIDEHQVFIEASVDGMKAFIKALDEKEKSAIKTFVDQRVSVDVSKPYLTEVEESLKTLFRKPPQIKAMLPDGGLSCVMVQIGKEESDYLMKVIVHVPGVKQMLGDTAKFVIPLDKLEEVRKLIVVAFPPIVTTEGPINIGVAEGQLREWTGDQTLSIQRKMEPTTRIHGFQLTTGSASAQLSSSLSGSFPDAKRGSPSNGREVAFITASQLGAILDRNLMQFFSSVFSGPILSMQSSALVQDTTGDRRRVSLEGDGSTRSRSGSGSVLLPTADSRLSGRTIVSSSSSSVSSLARSFTPPPSNNSSVASLLASRRGSGLLPAPMTPARHPISLENATPGGLGLLSPAAHEQEGEEEEHTDGSAFTS